MGAQKSWLIWRVLRALLIMCGAIFVVLIAAVVIVGVSTDHDTKVAGSAPPVGAPDPTSPSPAPLAPEAAKSAAAPRPAPAPTSVSAMKLNRDIIGCKDWDTYSRMNRFVVQGDRDAFAKIYIPALASGMCRRFKNGDDAFLMETAAFSASICLRPKGETACFWVPIDAAK